MQGDMIAAEMYTEFHFFKDYENFSRRSMKAGEVYITTNWCIYKVENEKFKHIRVAHFRLHDPKTARLCVFWQGVALPPGARVPDAIRPSIAFPCESALVQLSCIFRSSLTSARCQDVVRQDEGMPANRISS